MKLKKNKNGIYPSIIRGITDHEQIHAFVSDEKKVILSKAKLGSSLKTLGEHTKNLCALRISVYIVTKIMTNTQQSQHREPLR